MNWVSEGVKFVEPVGRLARVRYGLRGAVRDGVYGLGRVAFRRRLDRVAAPGEAGLNFGWLTVPRRLAETQIGGGVKLGHLRERFGEAREGFSTLYLVSSVLHLVPHVEELVDWAKARGVTVVWNQNGVAYPAWAGDFYPWFNEPMRRLMAKADYVIYQSEFCRLCADRYLGSFAGRSEVLWNPVDVERFSVREMCQNEGPTPRPTPRLLAMGTCHSVDRLRASVGCLAELVRRGVDARLTVAGELRWPGAEREAAACVAAAGVGDRLTFLPRFSQGDAPALYRGADVLLHPKYKDPCPTVPIEAMACGLPVVGSRSGGMPELVPPEAGVLVEVPDDWTRDHLPEAGGMADAVERILSDRVRFRQAARDWAVRSFDRRRWVDRHTEIFDELRH